MFDGKPCGRLLTGSVHELNTYCLMHAPGGKDDAPFQKEIDRILEQAGSGTADFTKFVFPTAKFEGRRFDAWCVFSGSVFLHEAKFRDAVFQRGAFFLNTIFEKSANFWDAKFVEDVVFCSKFKQKAGFAGTKFEGDADFRFSIFNEDAIFNGTTFKRRANFSRARFLELAEFRETKFGEEDTSTSGLVFALTEFSKPEAILFYKIDLRRALFHNNDVSNLNFSSVEWRRRKGSRRRMVFEEVVDLNARDVSALRLGPDGSDRDYGLIAELYQQLKKNYDERKDYWTAGDFHYGEMEMRRLRAEGTNWLARWIHRNLGFIALYKYASEYGESYRRPLVAILTVLALFTLLFPLAGLERNENPQANSAAARSSEGLVPIQELSYRNFREFIRVRGGNRWVSSAAFFGNSLMTTMSVAGFQKELRYEPSYPWGRALALLELLITSALVALFLLALRRQFKR